MTPQPQLFHDNRQLPEPQSSRALIACRVQLGRSQPWIDRTYEVVRVPEGWRIGFGDDITPFAAPRCWTDVLDWLRIMQACDVELLEEVPA
jgi:hypothetical protein